MKHLLLFLKVSIVGALLFSCANHELIENSSNEEAKVNIEFTEFIDESAAIEIAEKFIQNNQVLPENQTRSEALNLKTIQTYYDSTTFAGTGFRSTSTDGYSAYYYVFNIGEDEGFIIVSGDGATMPVLGYSTESTFDPNNIPVNMADVLADYRSEIKHRRKNKIVPTEAMLSSRNASISGVAQTRAASSVSPLLGSIQWNQNPYYNAYCPTGTPVGCVATATCQIMRYWEYPSRGKGTYGYRSENYGYLSFDYNYALNWSNMQKTPLRGPNDDIAKFCYGVAVGINMNFSPHGSGAWQHDVPRLLTEHYYYPNTMRVAKRNSYGADEWATMLRNELSAGRPVQYAGYGSGGGHSFVCDGYTSNGYFHFNWGWGGVSDGNFLLHALNPGSLGTGGGSGGFNYNQEVLIGIQPPGGGNGGDPDPDPNPNPNPDPTDYCQSKGLYSFYTYIKGVEIGYMSNITDSNNGYAYFNTKNIEAPAGANVWYRLTPGFYSQSYPEYWSVWIDYNKNGSFDSNEQVIQYASYSAFSGTFTLPSSLAKGTYRVRVSMKWNSYPSPCEVFEHGEVEDYNLVIT